VAAAKSFLKPCIGISVQCVTSVALSQRILTVAVSRLMSRFAGAYDDVEKLRPWLGMGCNLGGVRRTPRSDAVASHQLAVRWRRRECEPGAYFPDWISHLSVGHVATRPAACSLYTPPEILERCRCVFGRNRHWSHFIRHVIVVSRAVFAGNGTRIRTSSRWRHSRLAGCIVFLPFGANPFSSEFGHHAAVSQLAHRCNFVLVLKQSSVRVDGYDQCRQHHG